MRWLVFALLIAHGSIHFLGFAKAFALAEVPLLEPIGKAVGSAWLGAGIALIASGVLLLAAPRSWWMLGFAAVVVSQAVIVTSWSDARFGTLANLLVLLAVAYGFASEGPLGLRAEYRREVASRLDRPAPEGSISQADLSGLPGPIQRYLQITGSVGRPRIRDFSARFEGRIRGTADEGWMEFTAEQHDFPDEPARFFLMKAKRGGVPIDVLHTFVDGSATMRVRLLSAVPLIDAGGPDLTRAETVTLFNDLCFLAAGALVDAGIRWEAIDGRSVRGLYTVGSNTISAVLTFNDSGELVDFVSDDRLAASSDGTQFVRQRWSTPLSEYRDYGARRVASRGEGWWHPPDGGYAYIELEVLDVDFNVGARPR